MDDDVDLVLGRYRSDIHSMCAAFPEPVTAYKIKMEFLDNFDDEVPVRKFGYMSLDAFLDDHPGLQKVLFDGKVCYRAKVTAATQDIQNLVAKQKKKKKRGANKKGAPRGGLQRSANVNRSFRQNIANGSFSSSQRPIGRGGKSFSFTHRQQQNLFSAPDPTSRHTTMKATSNCLWGNNTKASWHMQNRPEPAYTNVANRPHLSAFKPSLPCPSANYSVAESNPTIGAMRIMKALDKCSGKATLTKLNWAYQDLFKTQLDSAEMLRHFGTKNMRKIHEKYLADKIELNTGYGGQWSFLSKENAQKQKDWESQHKDAVFTEGPRYVWAYPNVKELYDKTVELLINMYPETVSLDHISEIYTRAYGVKVNTVDLYCKTWEDLIKTTFTDRLRLTSDNRIALSAQVIKLKNLNNEQKNTPQKVSTVKRVTAKDLGLEYSDDEDEDEDFDDEDSGSSSSGAISEEKPKIQNTVATLSTQNHTSARNFSAFIPPPGLGPPGLPEPPRFEKVESVLQPPTRRSVFERMTLSGKNVYSSRLADRGVTTSVFGNVLEKDPLDIKLPTEAPKKPSVFAAAFAKMSRTCKSPCKMPGDDIETSHLHQEMDKLALNQRMDAMDSLLEQAKESKQRQSSLSFGFGCNSTTKLSSIHASSLIGFCGASLLKNDLLEAKGIVSNKTEKTNPFVLPDKSATKSAEKQSGEITISPGNYNVRFNGRSEQLSVTHGVDFSVEIHLL